MDRTVDQYPASVFSATADPHALYLNGPMQEALASVVHGIRSRRGFVALVGESGTGKTSLLRRVADGLASEATVAFVLNPVATFDELLETLCIELGVPIADETRTARLRRLNDFLVGELVADRYVVVLIDDAHLIDDAVLEQLRLVGNLETTKEKILQIVLSGQPALEQRLAATGLRQLRQRISVWARLEPMRAHDVADYIATRFAAAGIERQQHFRESDLRRVWRAARGVPRLINVICDNALIMACARGEMPVSERTVSRAIYDVTGRKVGHVSARAATIADTAVTNGALAAGVLLAIAISGASYYSYQGAVATADAEAIASQSVSTPKDALGASAQPSREATVKEAPGPQPDLGVASAAATEAERVAGTPTAAKATPRSASPPHRRATVAASDFPDGPWARIRTVGQCGNGRLDPGEECDDGNSDETDACLSSCRENVCGDGHVRAWVEECDDSNDRNDDACLFGCVLATCGDGYLNEGVEECDDGNRNDADGCRNDCTITRAAAVGEPQQATR